MIWLIFSICIVVSVTGVASKGCTGFHYDGPDGQESWCKHYEQCAGKHQSPIDLDSCYVTMVALEPLQMDRFNCTVGKASLTNNGHTAMMIIDEPNKPIVSGGPLTGEYVFAQLHFHWGIDDTCGSEDKIDGKSFPLELHLVFYKKEYKSVDSALKFYDGLTVLLADKPNPKYESFVQLLSQVIEPGQIAVFPKTPTSYDLLPNDLSQYFTYHESLTTPPCSESVTWIDFRETVKIKSYQNYFSSLAAFRKLQNADGHPLINNFRAIQPLGDRVVRRNIGNRKDTNLANNRMEVKATNTIQRKILQDVKNIPPPPLKKKM